MKRLFIITLLLTLSELTFGQTASNSLAIQNGPVQKNTDGYTKQIFGKDSSGFYVLRSEDKKSFIQHWNNDMILDKAVEIERPIRDGWHLRIHTAKQIGSHFYLIFIRPARTGDIPDTLFARKLNVNTLQTEGDLILMSYGLNFLSVVSPFEFVTYSNDSSNNYKLLVITKFNDTINGEKHAVALFRLFNADLKITWSVKYQNLCNTGFYCNGADIRNISLDQEGNCVFLRYDTKWDSLVKTSTLMRAAMYEAYVVSITGDGSRINSKKIKLPEYYITDLTIKPSNNRQVIVAGFYAHEFSYQRAGTFYMRLDIESLNTIVSSQTDVNPDFFTEGSDSTIISDPASKQKKKSNKSNYGYLLNIIENTNDQSIILIGERYFVTTATIGGSNRFLADGAFDSSVSNTNYEYEDILCFSFNSSGMLNWKSAISKHQSSVDYLGRFGSFALIKTAQAIHFIYNDHPANGNFITNPSPEKYKAKIKSDVVVVSLGQDGKMNKQTLVSNSTTDCDIIPSLSPIISNNQTLLYFVGKDGYWLSRVTSNK